MKLSKIAIATCAFAAAMASAPAVFAAVVTQTIVLGTSNDSHFASQDMAHLTITEDHGNTVWTLTANWDNALNVRDPFIFGLKFTDTKTAAPVSYAAVGSSTIAFKDVSATEINFKTANNSGRFIDGEAATWTFNNTKLTDFGSFELHVNSVTASGGSVKFTKMTSAVPEPETYGMLLAGLGLIGFVARRRAAK